MPKMHYEQVINHNILKMVIYDFMQKGKYEELQIQPK